MSAEAWPTEAAATAAVDAAARKAYEDGVARQRDVMPPSWSPTDWDDLPPVAKLEVRNQVLPHVWAALEALPDPRHAAWAEGNAAGYREAVLPIEEPEQNPYPSGL